MENQLFRKVSMEHLSSPEQLDQIMTITSPRAWIGLLGVFCLLAVLIFWSIFGLITTKIDATGVFIKGNGGNAEILQAVLYLPFDQGRQVAKGMQVQLSIDQTSKGVNVSSAGQVVSVSPYPVTEEEMLSTLKNKGLLRLFSGQGQVVEVRVNPIKADLVNEGELCKASIIIRQQKPFTLFLPVQQ